MQVCGCRREEGFPGGISVPGGRAAPRGPRRGWQLRRGARRRSGRGARDAARRPLLPPAGRSRRGERGSAPAALGVFLIDGKNRVERLRPLSRQAAALRLEPRRRPRWWHRAVRGVGARRSILQFANSGELTLHMEMACPCPPASHRGTYTEGNLAKAVRMS